MVDSFFTLFESDGKTYLVQMFVEFFLLIGLIRLSLAVEKSYFCSGAFAIAVIIKGIVFASPVLFVAFDTSISLVMAAIYFFALSRFDRSSFAWWGIAFLGFFLLLIASFYWIPGWYASLSHSVSQRPVVDRFE